MGTVVPNIWKGLSGTLILVENVGNVAHPHPWHLLFHFHSITPACPSSSSSPQFLLSLVRPSLLKGCSTHRNPLKVAHCTQTLTSALENAPPASLLILMYLSHWPSPPVESLMAWIWNFVEWTNLPVQRRTAAYHHDLAEPKGLYWAECILPLFVNSWICAISLNIW